MGKTSRITFQLHWPTAVVSFLAGVAVTGAVLKTRAPLPPPSVQPPVVTPALPEPGADFLPPSAAAQSPAERAVIQGNAYYDQKRWAEAIVQYQQALAGGVDNPDVRTDLGNCFRFNGDPARALEQYRIAQARDSRHENSLFNTATLFEEVLHDTAKASEVWREYLKRFPQGQHAAMARHFVDRGAVSTVPEALPSPNPVAPQSPGGGAEVMDWLKRQEAGKAK